jgi:tetratricopeptide (TPR) repeat protein
MRRAAAYEGLAENSYALADYNIVLEKDPSNAQGHYARGLLYLRTKKYNLAAGDFTTAVQKDTSYVNSCIKSGNTARTPEEKIAFYTAVLTNNSDNFDILEKRGDAFSKLEQYDSAIQDYSKALSLKRNDPVILGKRGTAYKSAEQYNNAVSDFSTALRSNPEDDKLFSGRSSAYYQLMQYDNALTDIDNALKKNKDASYFNFKGDILSTKGKYKDAIKAYDSAIAINDTIAVYYLDRGVAHYSKGGFEKAVADFSKAIEIDPGIAEYYMRRGFAYHRTGQFPLALRDYNEARRLNPDLSEQIAPKLELAGQSKRDLGLFKGSIWE